MQNQYFKLKQNLTPAETNAIEVVKPILCKREIEIQKGEFNKQPWVKIFSCISESTARKLSTYANEAPIELKFILMPKFPHLKELYLSCNRITSIQSIANLDAPNLEDLVLLTNHITSIKSLRKGYFPVLKEINISNNPIIDPSPLTELPTKELIQLHIQRWANLPIIGESKRWAVKLHPSSTQLKALTMKSTKRILQFTINKMIQAKYPIFRNN